jgi:hypothetical protein
LFIEGKGLGVLANSHPCHPAPVTFAQPRSGKYVITLPVQMFQDTKSTVYRHAQFKTGTARQFPTQGNAPVHEIKDTLNLHVNQSQHGGVRTFLPDMIFINAASGHFVLWQINAPAFDIVLFDVLEKIDQLQPTAYGIRACQIVPAGLVVKMQYKISHRIGGVTAIVHDLGKIRVTFFRNIHAKGSQQIIERGQGKLKLPDGVREGDKHGVLLRLTFGNAVQFFDIVIQFCQACIDFIVTLVSEVIGRPGKGVDNAYRFAQLFGNQA